MAVRNSWNMPGKMCIRDRFDQPTGLYTFHELKKQLPSFISHGMEGAVLLFDVDRLQRINDILGYLVGDEVLQRLGQKCQSMEGVISYRGPGGKFYCCLLYTSRCV